MKNTTALLIAAGMTVLLSPVSTLAEDGDQPRRPRPGGVEARSGAPGDRRPGDRNRAPDGESARPMPPLIAALDANRDGVIDEQEIANAQAALRKLDKNGDGRLTMDELRPPRPDGDRAQGVRPRNGESGNDQSATDDGPRPPRRGPRPPADR